MQTKHLIYMAYLLKPTNHTWKTISQKRLLKSNMNKVKDTNKGAALIAKKDLKLIKRLKFCQIRINLLQSKIINPFSLKTLNAD